MDNPLLAEYRRAVMELIEAVRLARDAADWPAANDRIQIAETRCDTSRAALNGAAPARFDAGGPKESGD